MPWSSNADVKSSVKGLEKYSDEQVTRFRKAANGAFASCMTKSHNQKKCEGYAIAVGWTALKGKAKHEDGTPPTEDELFLALLEYFYPEEEEDDTSAQLEADTLADLEKEYIRKKTQLVEEMKKRFTG